jgi:general stress protein YciG
LNFYAPQRELISKVMREMGRKGGKAAGGKGGKKRMAALTPEQRNDLARKAAQSRWAKAKKKLKPSAK